jgi:hypothetical protein
LPREIGNLQKLRTLNIKYTGIEELPREIGSLQQLETLDIRDSYIKELPKEMWSLQQLKTLYMTGTRIIQLPKAIGKLRNLEHLLMGRTEVAKIPREIGVLKELKSLKLDNCKLAVLPLEVCQVSGALLELPESIHHALKKSDVLSELAGEMLSFGLSGGLVVGAKQMHMPMWIRDHFNNLQELDIRICKLEEEGLIILGEMPNLKKLTLRFEVVPREPVVVSSQGFAMIRTFTVDSRVPRVTFQEGAMPMLGLLVFEFWFYAGSPNKDHVGINHLGSLGLISFDYNQDWYDSLQCIRRSIDAMRKEAQKHRNNVECYLRGRQEHKNWNCQMLPPLNESIDSMPTPPPLPLQIDSGWDQFFM